MISVSEAVPVDEVVRWLQVNQDKYHINVANNSAVWMPLHESLVLKSNRFPDYHLRKPRLDEVRGGKRKPDKDSTFINLPRDLNGERLKKGRTKMNQDVTFMVDSNGLMNKENAERVYKQYRENGYIYVKGLLPRDDVMALRGVVMEGLHELNLVDDDGKCSNIKAVGYTIDTGSGEPISGKKDYYEETSDQKEDFWMNKCSTPAMAAVRESVLLKKVISILAMGKAKVERCKHRASTFTPNYSWLRVKAPSEFTTTHADEFYYRKYTGMFINPYETEQLEASFCKVCEGGDHEDRMLVCDECNATYHMDCLDPPLSSAPSNEWYCIDCAERPLLGTCWIPLGDTPVDHGVLAVLPGSTTLPDYATTLKSDNAQLSRSYFRHGRDLTWHSTGFTAGDVVLFDSRLVHTTSRNHHQAYRLSLDFRYCVAPVGRKNYGQTALTKFIEPLLTDFSTSTK